MGMMEVKGNLLKESREALLAKFPSDTFKKVAHVQLGEPGLEFKKRTHEVTLKNKWQQEQKKREKDAEKRRKDVEKAKKKALKEAAKKQKELKKAAEAEKKEADKKKKEEEAGEAD